MALFPCSVQRHLYRGAASHAYVGLGKGSFEGRYRLRLCSAHMNQLEECADSFRVDPDEQVPEFEFICFSCDRPLDNTVDQVQPWFLTTFPRGTERRDFYAVKHAECRLPVWLEPYVNQATMQ